MTRAGTRETVVCSTDRFDGPPVRVVDRRDVGQAR
jgi:hypothetical protein